MPTAQFSPTPWTGIPRREGVYDEMTPWSQWAAGVLDGIGAARDYSTLDSLWAWSGAESLPRDRVSICNPLNSTLFMPGAVAFNTLPSGGHVWQYPDISTGIVATIHTLLIPVPGVLANGYDVIVGNLRSSVPRQEWQNACPQLGTWGTGCGWLNRTDFGPPPLEALLMNQATKEAWIQLFWLATQGHTAPSQQILEDGDGKGRPGTNQLANDGSNLNVIVAQFATVDSGPAFLADWQKAVANAANGGAGTVPPGTKVAGTFTGTTE